MRPGSSPLALAIACLIAVAAPAFAAKLPRPDLLGIRLGMDDHEVRTRLSKIGAPVEGREGEEEEEERKQTWNVRDRRYASITVRFDADERLEWATAFVRQDARVKYRDIGDVATAYRSGSWIYTWTLPFSTAMRPYAVTARGSDANYASSVSIHPPGPPGTGTPAKGDSAR